MDVVRAYVAGLWFCLTSLCRANDNGLPRETFSVTKDRFGEHVIVGLRPGGSLRDITESNKDAYVDFVVAHRIADHITEWFWTFMEGLSDVLQLYLLRAFDEHELELLND